MLELLAKYAEGRLDTEPGFKPKQVRWLIVCDKEGRFSEAVEIGDTNTKKNPGHTYEKCPDLSQPELVGGSETRSHFLVDTAEVVALLGKNASTQKIVDKHNYYIKMLTDASTVMPELGVLAKLLQDDSKVAEIRERLEAQKAKPSDKVTFKIGDIVPVESPAWHDWWREFRKGLASVRKDGKARKKEAGKASGQMRCLVSGDLVQPASTHPKISGLGDVGGQPSGSALIGFDKEAFRSYGLSQSANAAVSETMAYAYRDALNELLEKHSRRLAGTKVAHWFKKRVPPEDDPLSWLEIGEEDQEHSAQQRARELLESIRTGKRVDLLNNYFYALTLSGSGGRVMVRDWMEGQFERLIKNITCWFDDLSIVRRDGMGLAPEPKFLAVLGATVRDLNDLPPPFVSKMWGAAARNEQIPYYAVSQALSRLRMGMVQDEPPNHARMGLIKAYHLRKQRTKGGNGVTPDLKPYLNEDHPYPAYHCGRLMAVLADVQRAALGDVGAGVVQRYYAAASATPALVLGRLTRTSQFHLNKLEPGLAHWFDGIIAGIWGKIKDELPRTLSLEEQSLFALGYYQQMAHMRAGKASSLNKNQGGQ